MSFLFCRSYTGFQFVSVPSFSCLIWPIIKPFCGQGPENLKDVLLHRESAWPSGSHGVRRGLPHTVYSVCSGGHEGVRPSRWWPLSFGTPCSGSVFVHFSEVCEDGTVPKGLQWMLFISVFHIPFPWSQLLIINVWVIYCSVFFLSCIIWFVGFLICKLHWV